MGSIVGRHPSSIQVSWKLFQQFLYILLLTNQPVKQKPDMGENITSAEIQKKGSLCKFDTFWVL